MPGMACVIKVTHFLSSWYVDKLDCRSLVRMVMVVFLRIGVIRLTSGLQVSLCLYPTLCHLQLAINNFKCSNCKGS